MLGILKLFYNNNRDIKKREGSKQPINLWSFFNPKDIILILTPVILKTNNF